MADGGEPGADRRPLRVGLLLDSFELARWQRTLLADVASSPFARIVCVAVGPGALERHDPLLCRLYRALDDRLFGTADDAFQPGDVRELLRDVPIVAIAPEADGTRLSEVDARKLATHDLDVALSLGSLAPGGVVATVARRGVWTLRQGAGGDALLEVLEDRRVTPAALEEHRSDTPAPRTLYLSYGVTDSRSARRNRHRCCLKSARFAGRALRDVALGGTPALPCLGAAAPPPGNLRMGSLWTRLLLRYARDKLLNLFAREQWYLAYRFEHEPRPPQDMSGLQRILPPRDMFWADPFPVQHEGRTWLFFEEMPYATWRGHLSVLELDPERGPGPPTRVLERPFHLSYPFVFRWRGELWMLPEMSESRTLTLLRGASFPHRWEEEAVLFEGVRMADATLEEIDGRWWLFATMAEPGADTVDELHVFHAPSPLGPWTPHRRNPVRSDCRAARPAGGLIRWDGALYRPAQKCEPSYGASIVVHRILRLDPEEYVEEEAFALGPEADPMARRIHTVNRDGNLFVADFLRYHSRFAR